MQRQIEVDSRSISEDIEIIVEELLGAFEEARENDNDTMHFSSMVNSKFHQRVERVYRVTCNSYHY